MAARTNTFTGEYRYSIDNKGRINIPSAYRRALSPASDETFVLTRGLDRCILVYPLEEWERIEDNLRELTYLRSKERDFIRQILRWATPSKFDKQGRVMIPAPLLKMANLEDQALIIGVLNKIEIWNPDTVEEKYGENFIDLDDDDYESLAEQVRL